VRLVTVAEMQEAEKRSGVPVPQLMENAGLAVAQEAWLLLGELAERRIVVLAGPGNNGGDGLVAARHLREWGADVSVYLLKPRGKKDAVFAPLLKAKTPVVTAEEDYKRLEELLAGADLVIDALLGTGRARPVEGALAEVLDRLRAARQRPLAPRLLAVDLPTGIDADTGAADPHCVAADATVALGWSKVGLHVLPGSQLAGRAEAVEIGMPKTLESDGWTELMTARWARPVLPERPAGANKGTFGRALVVAGSPRYVGAAYLACMGGLRAGAGLVTLACASTIYPILAAKLTEATFEPLPDEEGYLSAEAAHSVGQILARASALRPGSGQAGSARAGTDTPGESPSTSSGRAEASGAGRGYDSLLVGPGLGQEGYVRAFMRALLPLLKADSLRGVVIDADGLNNLSKVEGWWKELAAPTVITPHPGELSRLTGLPVDEIQSDRLAVARGYAGEWGVVVVLKGANTVVAAPDGRARLSPFANPGLASGGTGDVLAGAIAGLIAQGMEPYEAASLGVYLHGLAGERVREELGSAGMIASDLLVALPRAIKELRG